MNLIGAKEACKMLKVRLPRLYELTRKGAIPAVRLGRRQVRFDPDVLKAWVEERSRLNVTARSGE